MRLTYGNIDLLFELDEPASVDTEHWTDRAPNLPLFGFLVAATLALPFWGLVGWTVWALVA